MRLAPREAQPVYLCLHWERGDVDRVIWASHKAWKHFFQNCHYLPSPDKEGMNEKTYDCPSGPVFHDCSKIWYRS